MDKGSLLRNEKGVLVGGKPEFLRGWFNVFRLPYTSCQIEILIKMGGDPYSQGEMGGGSRITDGTD